LSSTSSSCLKGTSIVGHHHDAYTSLVPWLKSLFSSSGAGAIVGSSSCAKETYIVNTTVNNSNASLASCLHLLQHISSTNIIKTTIVLPSRLVIMASLRMHYSHPLSNIQQREAFLCSKLDWDHMHFPNMLLMQFGHVFHKSIL
jgi:hypothetical protein